VVSTFSTTASRRASTSSFSAPMRTLPRFSIVSPRCTSVSPCFTSES
jgi:hypothetical protein